MLSRRKVVGGLVGLLALGSLSLLGRLSQPTANEFLRAISTEIPGAKSIEKHETLDAEYCLVHVRQQHRDGETSYKDNLSIKAVHRDIGSILSYFIDNFSVEHVFDEGFFVEDEAWLVETKRKYMDIMASDQSLTSDDDVITLAGQAVEDGAIFLYLQDELKKIYGAETKGARERGAMGPRENELLRIISANEDPLAITVYGGGHNWLNNIQTWNQRNPDSSFSLVDITPQSLTPDFDFLRVMPENLVEHLFHTPAGMEPDTAKRLIEERFDAYFKSLRSSEEYQKALGMKIEPEEFAPF